VRPPLNEECEVRGGSYTKLGGRILALEMIDYVGRENS